MNYNFEWDPIKAAKNKRKHDVSFEEAAEVFLDPLQLNMLDGKTDDIEERWITIGATPGNAKISGTYLCRTA